MNSLFKILMMSAACSAPLFASDCCGGGGGGGGGGVVFVGEEGKSSASGLPVQKSPSVESELKRAALKSAFKIVEARYRYARNLEAVLGNDQLEDREKYAKLTSVFKISGPVSIPELKGANSEDIRIYLQANKVVHSVDKSELDTRVDECYVFFSFHTSAQEYQLARAAKEFLSNPLAEGKNGVLYRGMIAEIHVQQREEMPGSEYFYMNAILELLRPHVSSQAALFSSCFVEGPEVDKCMVHFDVTKLASVEWYMENASNKIAELGLLPRSYWDSVCIELPAHRERRNAAEKTFESTLIEYWPSVSGTEGAPKIDMVKYVTVFYRNVAPALVRYNDFYKHDFKNMIRDCKR